MERRGQRPTEQQEARMAHVGTPKKQEARQAQSHLGVHELHTLLSQHGRDLAGKRVQQGFVGEGEAATAQLVHSLHKSIAWGRLRVRDIAGKHGCAQRLSDEP